MGDPHPPQNFSPPSFRNPQEGQLSASEKPHSPQKRRPTRFSAWQRGHGIPTSVITGRLRTCGEASGQGRCGQGAHPSRFATTVLRDSNPRLKAAATFHQRIIGIRRGYVEEVRATKTRCRTGLFENVRASKPDSNRNGTQTVVLTTSVPVRIRQQEARCQLHRIDSMSSALWQGKKLLHLPSVTSDSTRCLGGDRPARNSIRKQATSVARATTSATWFWARSVRPRAVPQRRQPQPCATGRPATTIAARMSDSSIAETTPQRTSPLEAARVDPLRDLTRKERRNLLVVSLGAVLIAKAGLVPTEVGALGRSCPEACGKFERVLRSLRSSLLRNDRAMSGPRPRTPAMGSAFPRGSAPSLC